MSDTKLKKKIISNAISTSEVSEAQIYYKSLVEFSSNVYYYVKEDKKKLFDNPLLMKELMIDSVMKLCDEEIRM